MNKEKIIQAFVNQVQIIAEEWTRAVAEGKITHPHYTNQIFYLHQTLEEVMKKDEETNPSPQK